MLRTGAVVALLSKCGAPDGVDAEVFVKDHEEVVEPAFAKALIVELGVSWSSRGGLFGRSEKVEEV